MRLLPLFFLLIFIPDLSAMDVRVHGLERIESENVKIARRVMGAASLCVGALLLYDTVKKAELSKKRVGAITGSLLFGIGAFTTEELGLSRPVYHKDNSREEDREISTFAFAYKDPSVKEAVLSSPSSFVSKENKYKKASDSDEESDDEEYERKKQEGIKKDAKEGVVQIPLHFLQKVYAGQLGKKANELYLAQQKPILVRLPIIGVLFGGLYSQEGFRDLQNVCNNGTVSYFGLAWLLVFGLKRGIKHCWKEEKTPEDKKFELWVNSCILKTNYVWGLYEKNKKNSDDPAYYFGVLPAELIEHINSFVVSKNESTVGMSFKKENGVKYVLVSKEDCATYVAPYIGPYIELKKADTCYDTKVAGLNTAIRYNDYKVLIRGKTKQEKDDCSYGPIEEFLTALKPKLWQFD